MVNSSRTDWKTYCFDEMAIEVKDRVEVPSESGFERYVGLTHLDAGSLKIRRWGSTNEVEKQKMLFKSGDIIFGRRNAYLRRVAVADFDGVCSAHAMVLRAKPAVVLPDFLPFFMQTEPFWQAALRNSAGSLSPTINWSNIKKEEFVLPPLEEQRRIVELLVTNNLGIDSVLAVAESLRLLKQSLLNSEFPHDSSGQQSTPLANLLENGTLDLQTGPFGTVLAAKEYTYTGWPIINPTDIQNGVIAFSDGPCVSESTASRLEKYRMQVGDVLLARKGEIDKACIAEDYHKGWIVGSDCIRLRSEGSIVLPSYLLYFLQSGRTARMLASYAHGTVMPGLNEKMLARLELQIPGHESQSEFVFRAKEIDFQLARVENRINQARVFGSALLAKLFPEVGSMQ